MNVRCRCARAVRTSRMKCKSVSNKNIFFLDREREYVFVCVRRVLSNDLTSINNKFNGIRIIYPKKTKQASKQAEYFIDKNREKLKRESIELGCWFVGQIFYPESYAHYIFIKWERRCQRRQQLLKHTHTHTKSTTSESKRRNILISNRIEPLAANNLVKIFQNL